MSYRVTNSMMQMLMLNDMHNNLSKMLDLQQQLATQRKYNAASDNPNAVTKGMGLDTSITEGLQYISNLQDAQSWLKFTDDALGQMNDCFQRIRQLAIQAGDGAYEGVDLEAIAVELKELKETLRSLANSTIGQEYLFAGLKACGIPFGLGPNGEVVYNGNDYELAWEFSRQQTGQVSLTGRDVFPQDETTNYLKGVEVPMDFKWTGRNEILEFKVGWRAVKVRIPEKWQDEILNGLDDPTDYNRFRDPGEKLEGWSLDEISNLINSSMEMGDVSKLLKATVVKDTKTGTQYLQIQSLTGEPVQLTSWPEEDARSLAEGIKGAAYGPVGRTATVDGTVSFRFSDNAVYSVDVKKGESLQDIAKKLNDLPEGKMWAAYKTDGTSEWIDIVSRTPGDYFRLEAAGGATNLFAPQQAKASSATHQGQSIITTHAFDTALSYASVASGTLTINQGNDTYKIDVFAGNTIANIAGAINADPGLAAAGFTASVNADGALEIVSTNGDFDVVATGGLMPLFSDGVSMVSSAVKNSAGKYALETGELGVNFATNGDGAFSFEYDGKEYWIDLPAGSSLQDAADALNNALGSGGANIPGFSATVKTGLSKDGNSQVQWLSIETTDKSFKLSGFGDGAAAIGAFTTGSEPIYMNNDHTHIGFAAMMGMETAVKSTELALDATLGDTTVAGNALHLKFASGSNRGEVFINDSANLTLEELAKRINSVCGTWLQAVVETDEPDGSDPFADPLHNSGDNKEAATQRLVLRTLDGSPFAVYDGPGKTVSGVPYPSGNYAQQLGINTALVGESTQPGGAVLYPDDGTGAFDENMPALLEVKVGDRTFQVKVCKNNCGTAEKVAAAIVRQVNEQYGGTLLAWDGNNIDPTNPNAGTFALYAVTGEPLRVTDKGYGDPRFTEYTGGVAMQLGIAAGITSNVALDTDAAAADGTIRISTPGHTIDVPVLAGETLHDIANRIRDYAGSWLDVSFVDDNIGGAGGNVRMSIAAKDGSAVSVLDVNGSVAWDFGLDTGLVGTTNLIGWQPTTGDTLTISVNGAEHTIDLWDSDGTPPGPIVWSPEDLADMINTRFQGQDIRAEVLVTKDAAGNITNKRLALWSPKGYTFEVTGTGSIPAGIGFTPGVNTESKSHGGTGPFNQNVTIRTGDNQKKVDFFGVMDNLVNTVEGGNVDGISDVMLTQLDNWMNTLLKNRALAGALINRYAMTEGRLVSNNTGYEEIRTNTVGIDLAEVITQYEMASGVYEASLAAIARIMQPSLLDFLR